MLVRPYPNTYVTDSGVILSFNVVHCCEYQTNMHVSIQHKLLKQGTCVGHTHIVSYFGCHFVSIAADLKLYTIYTTMIA